MDQITCALFSYKRLGKQPKLDKVFVKVIRVFIMSESDTSSITSTDVSDSAENSSSDGEVDIGSIEPYQDEPLASENDSSASESENLLENDDPDNIPRIVLERRFERTISVQDW